MEKLLLFQMDKINERKSPGLLQLLIFQEIALLRMVCITFLNFFSFNLRNNIFQSAKKCEMASFYKTSLHVDLNEAAKYVKYHTTHIASLLIVPSHTRTD